VIVTTRLLRAPGLLDEGGVMSLNVTMTWTMARTNGARESILRTDLPPGPASGTHAKSGGADPQAEGCGVVPALNLELPLRFPKAALTRACSKERCEQASPFPPMAHRRLVGGHHRGRGRVRDCARSLVGELTKDLSASTSTAGEMTMSSSS